MDRIKKNDVVEITIEDMTNEGEGIGHANGYTLFVKDAVIGDRILAHVTKAKKNYGYARVEEVLAPSPDRVSPRCPEARRCGGCRLQELSYEKQLSFKEGIVRRNLQRIGGFADIPMKPIIGMENPWRYRNKAQYPIGFSKKEGKIVAGYYAGRTHSIIDVRDCHLSPAHNADILRAVVAYAEKYHIEPYDETTGRGLLRHLLVREGFASGEILVCLVINGRKLPHADKLVAALLALGESETEKSPGLLAGRPGIVSICLNVNKQRTNVILGEEVVPLYGDPWITDSLEEFSFRISPLSFYQVNPVQTVRLYNAALEYAQLTGSETVFDLFCGIGTISHFLSKKANAVYGVEIVPQAIEDAKANASRNGIANAKFFAAAAEDVAERGYFDVDHPLVRPDVVVVDPPRKGCEESLLRTIRRLHPDRIVYVSCDSATLARDLKVLCETETDDESSYKIERVRACDMFPHSCHVECVVLMSRN
ncbi:MAG: 23S rRNA (uracil(1939)-C(5))-methyltransferase RlmD [Lachnospiraceae bacterium]|nr:23S rRNA (uracil(1939)-C(5))-methyltransferase RlmD [Lachnospiraceae bacterium]